MHKPSSARDYFIAFFIALILLVIFGSYLYFRRGYLFDAPLTADMLFVPNKILVGAGTVLLAFTFLIGPIVRYFDRFDQWLNYRKEIGIVGGILVLFHVAISYFLLPLKFPQERFSLDSASFLAGLAGTFLLIFLLVISLKKAIEIIGAGKWWFLQRWGLRLVIFFTLIHVYVMKWHGWVRWWNTGGNATPELARPLLPGLGLLITMFLTWVVIVRMYETVFLFKDFGLKPKEITNDPTLNARGRKFFLITFWMLMILYVVVFTHWTQ